MFKSHCNIAIFSLALALLCIILTPYEALSQTYSENVAITFISGNVLVLKKDTTQWQPVSPGDLLSEGDSIKTLAGAKAKLQFPSGSTITLKENTSVTIKKLGAKGLTAVDKKTEVFIPKGRIKAVIEGLEKDSHFEVKSPISISGVRGTIFYLNVVEESEKMLTGSKASYWFFDMLLGVKECYAASGNLIAEMFVEQGNVDFTNLISNITYSVGGEEGTTADEKGNITPPNYVPPEKQQEWKEGFETPGEGGGGEEGKSPGTTPVTQKGEDSTVEEESSEEGEDVPEPDEGTDTNESKDDQDKNNPTDTDSDGDGVPDSLDVFPNDPNEWQDSDGDGIGDNADDFPNDASEWQDTDGDGVGDNSDVFPNNSGEWLDNDKDGIGDNADTDDDNDGVPDDEDDFPLNSSESVDTDGDGIGNNTDTDDDGDGVPDDKDDYPLDSTKWSDETDGSIGIDIDTDADGDDVPDDEDDFPYDPDWSKWTGSEEDADPDTIILEAHPDDPDPDPEAILVLNGREDYELAVELADLYEDIDDMETSINLAMLDNDWEQIRDAQTGKVVRDVYGNRVRLANYVLRPTNQKVAIVFLSHRRDGSQQGVSSLSFEVAFNQNINGLDLKTLPWSDYMSSDENIYYNTDPAGVPLPEQMTLSARNPYDDCVKMWESFDGNPGNVYFDEVIGMWQQDMDMAGSGVEINGMLRYLEEGSADWWNQQYTNGPPLTIIGYIIDDYGNEVGGDLSFQSTRGILRPREHNLELIFESDEFEGERIDVIVAPEIMRSYDND